MIMIHNHMEMKWTVRVMIRKIFLDFVYSEIMPDSSDGEWMP